MLERQAVEREEEELRQAANRLDDAARAAYYQRVEKRLRDPDTYATLNFLFITGLHHFYLKRWARGALSLTGFFAGVILIFAEQYLIGVLLIAAIGVWELYELFRSQLIVQDYNNKVMRAALEETQPRQSRR
jgi:TM2 domain-containing membrane protein YozV